MQEGSYVNRKIGRREAMYTERQVGGKLQRYKKAIYTERQEGVKPCRQEGVEPCRQEERYEGANLDRYKIGRKMGRQRAMWT